MIAALLGLIVSAVFTGAALYINVAEQPARLVLEPRALLAEWKPAYHNGTLMQAPLTIVALLLGAIAWLQTSSILFLLAGLAMLGNMPWTLLVIFPTNRRLTATPLDAADASTHSLVAAWGRLHAVRTLLGALATALFFAGLVVASPR